VQGAHVGPEIARDYPVPAQCFAISPGLMRSQSRGYLRLMSADPNGAIDLQPNFLQQPSDFAALVDSIDVCMDLAHAPAFASILDRPAAPDRRLSRREREDFVRNACTTFFHTCGTCAMGTGEHTVVDPRLRVHGIDGLRIVDASIIPVIPSCNTNAPVVMIAERAADFILGIDEQTYAVEELSQEHQHEHQ
jgi:choline dehydrogenase